MNQKIASAFVQNSQFIRKRGRFSIYWFPSATNIGLFFQEMTIAINTVMNEKENFIILGKFSIDISSSGPNKSKIESFRVILT